MVEELLEMDTLHYDHASQHSTLVPEVGVLFQFPDPP